MQPVMRRTQPVASLFSRSTGPSAYDMVIPPGSNFGQKRASPAGANGRWREPYELVPVTFRLNLARVDLVSIRLAVLCADCGSLSSACKAANMSKPSASQRLANLEATFGNRLFIRGYRGMRVTEAGVVFVGHARSILHEIERMSTTLAELTGSPR